MIEYKDLNLNQRIEYVNNYRVGNHDRIQTINELFHLKGQTIYLVMCPSQIDSKTFVKQSSHGFKSFHELDKVPSGTCCILTWTVGDLRDISGRIIKPNEDIEIKNQYFLYSFNKPHKAISCKDFNLIPNCYNFHAAFHTKGKAELYKNYRETYFEKSDRLERLMKNIGDKYPVWLTKSRLDEEYKYWKNVRG